MCKYCSLIIALEIFICRVCTLRDCDFKLYALDELCRWFLAFDYINFSRWLLIHVNDLGMWFSVHRPTGIFVV